ncbi:MAG: RNA polymerase sigma factor [Myxococcota bacterium]|nr:RNA polymerase sigma factor [Myxococcota bacterium]
MRRFQKGDQGAFEQLYFRYKAPIFSFLARQYAHGEAAKDLTQEVFVRIIRSAHSFRHNAKFATWIYTVARNLAIDSLRKTRHRKTTSLDQNKQENGSHFEAQVPSPDPSPDRLMASGRLRAELSRIIANLPDDQREVFLLREYCGLPFCEIARVVDAKEGTVKSRMRYALTSLRSELAEWADYARTLP